MDVCPHCSRPVRCKGLCNAHHLRLLRYGDPLGSAPRRTLRERFEAKVVKADDDACWLWRGAHFKQTGYALFSIKRASGTWQPTTAHRIAYQLWIGPLDDGLVLDHRCRNHGCVRPDHLEAVTHQKNILCGQSPSAIAVRTGRCQRGHEFTPENTCTRPNGKRECRTCARARDRIRNTTEARRAHYRAAYRRRKGIVSL